MTSSTVADRLSEILGRVKSVKLWRRPLFRLGLLGALWALALFLVAIPSLRTALLHHQEVQRLEQGLAELDTWTVAGKWLELSLPRRKAAVEKIWQDSFPLGRRREELFLDLAQVADHSGVQHFNLEEVSLDMPGLDSGAPAMGTDPDDGQSMFGGAVYGVPVRIPRITLDTYRVKASFQGNFKQAARFMGGLQNISRAVGVHDLVIRPEGKGIRVDLELNVYVSQQS